MWQLGALALQALASSVACSLLVWAVSFVRSNVALADRAWSVLIMVSAAVFDMSGARNTSTSAVLVFSIFMGLAATGITVKQRVLFASFEGFVGVAQAVTLQI